MDRDELDIYLELAKEAETSGDYKTADKIDGMMREAESTSEWFRRRLRNTKLPNERRELERQIRQTTNGPSFVDRFMRRQPSFTDAQATIDANQNISGGFEEKNLNMDKSLLGRLRNAFQSVYSQEMKLRDQFPQAFEAWEADIRRQVETQITDEIAKRTQHNDALAAWRADPANRDSKGRAKPATAINGWVSPVPAYGSYNKSYELTPTTVEDYLTIKKMLSKIDDPNNPLVTLRDAHLDTIQRAIGLARAAGHSTERDILAFIASDRQLRGFLYDNSSITDGMVKEVIRTNSLPMFKFCNNYKAFKKRMSPGAAWLIGAIVGGGITTIFKPKGEDKVVYVPVPGKPEALKIDNELEADRRKLRQFDTPIADLEAYLNFKKTKGVYTQGKTTKKELYNMAIQEKGGHFANNLIQYVLQKYGLYTPAGGGAEPDAKIGI
jgi:tryptophan 2,3-dioxygenase